MPVDPAIPQSLAPEQRLYERLAVLERRLSNLESYVTSGTVPVVDVLPPPGRPRLVILRSDGKVYRDTGGGWALV